MTMIETLANVFRTGFVFLLVITVLVFVHELGHYWAAKLFGMKVDAFAVMVGGLRKTDLRGFLTKQMVPSWVLWVLGVIASLVAMAGATGGNTGLFYAGMAFLTVIGPVWVISRLVALYHMTIWKGLQPLGLAWLGALTILFLGTGFRNLDIGYVLGLLMAGSAIAVIVLYYLPASRNHNEDEQGHGEITVEGQEVAIRYRPVWYRTDKHGTEFSLLLLPLGGFARIRGMQFNSEKDPSAIPGGFYSKPAWQRFIVLLAGPVFSVALGVGLLTFLGVVHGKGEPVPVVREFVDGSAAQVAGMKVGDRIMSVNDRPIESYYDFLSTVRFAYDKVGDELKPRSMKVGVLRGDQAMNFVFAGTISQSPDTVLNKDFESTGKDEYQVKFGFYSEIDFVPMSLSDAFVVAINTPLKMAAVLVDSVSSASKAKQNIGGPRATAEGTAEAVNDGIWSVIAMAAGLSIVLGITNLIPVPPLDGGQMLIAFIEILRGNRRLNPALQGTLHTVGFFLVMVLMVAPIVIDASRKSDENAAASLYSENVKRGQSPLSDQSPKP